MNCNNVLHFSNRDTSFEVHDSGPASMGTEREEEAVSGKCAAAYKKVSNELPELRRITVVYVNRDVCPKINNPNSFHLTYFKSLSAIIRSFSCYFNIVRVAFLHPGVCNFDKGRLL